MRRPVGLALTFALAVSACSGGPAPDAATTTAAADTTLPPDSTTTTTTTTTVPGPAGVPADFTRTVIEIDGVPFHVAVADTPDELSRGLMFVEELSPLDGMLFVYQGERSISHWMKNTLIPLDIAFFDAEGRLVNKRSMVPCPTEEAEADACEVYASEGPAAFSVEVPAGVFEDLPEDARLVIIGSLDGSGKEI